MKVVICGAGIAGLTLGWWLGRDSWDVVIVEKATGVRDEGYMIDFMSSGWEVAERMGLITGLRQIAYHIPGVQWIDERGRTQARIDYESFSLMLGGRLLSLMRGDLEQVLFKALPASVDLRFGMTIESIRDGTDRIEVTLSDGRVEEAELVVGADGIHSRVRALVFGEEGQFRRYLGYHTAAYVFEDPAAVKVLGGQFKIMALPARQAGFYPLRTGRVAAFFAHVDENPALPPDPVAQLCRIYGDLGWLVPTGLAHAAKLPGIYYDQIAQIEMPRWTLGHVALVGDACDAVSLLAGQGASLAMGTAYVLAQELRRQPTINAALDAYSVRLILDIRRKQGAGRKTARWIVPRTRLDIAVRNWTLRVALLPGLSGLLKPLLISGTESIIGGSRKN
jgi:2-polyprenyl-6-methoxyphenol hydroxylase-like FAD-dependent oxidoreductase